MWTTPTWPTLQPSYCPSGGHFIKRFVSVFHWQFALSQSDARISVAYNSCQWKTLTKRLMKCPPGLLSLGPLPSWTTPNQDHYLPEKLLTRTNTYMVESCPGAYPDNSPIRTIPHRTGIGPDEWFYWFVYFVAVLVGRCPRGRGPGGP